MREEPLTGGNSTAVVRRGDTVRRTAGPWTASVHTLLRRFRDAGITEVPEPLGLDPAGREMLTYLVGDAAHYPLPDWLWAPTLLQDAGALLRRIHDASVDLLASADRLTWQLPRHEPAEVVCHNDVAPYNMVFDHGRLVGLIDFDTASPGPRIWDLAYLAYRMVPFGEHGGASAPTDAERRQRLDALIDAYGWPFAPRAVLQALVPRLDELAGFAERSGLERGRPDLAEHAVGYRRDRDHVLAVAPTVSDRPR